MTPHERAEAMYREACVMPQSEVISYFEAQLTEHVRALLADPPEDMLRAGEQAQAGGIIAGRQLAREVWRLMTGALRRKAGV
jgi:hypothetical protein